MTWLSAREIAGLPGMPGTERRTRERLTRLCITSRPRAGREGGGGLEYDTSALPAEVRAAIAARTVARAAGRALAQVDSAPVASFAPPDKPLPAPLAPTSGHTRRPPSLADKATADARMLLVNMVLDLVPLHGIKRACATVALQFASGQASAELQVTARKANQRARADQVSARTLERYIGIYRAEGWWGLLPAPAPEPSLDEVEQDVAAVLGLFHSRDARFRKLSGAAKEVTRQLGRDFDSWKALYARARRALDKFGKSHQANTALIKARFAAGAQRDAQLPFKWRDDSVLACNDVWMIDGHTFKAKVRHPDHGAPFAPELTMCIDPSCKFITGWSVNLSENVRAVGDALRHGIGLWGVPAILYGDNGAGETARQIDCPIDGLCARLGIDHRTGIPGKPQGHGGIERVWQTVAINCARQFGSYQGKDVDGGTFRKVAAELQKEQRAVRRAEQTGEVVVLSSKVPTWQQFIDAVEKAVHEYNHEHRHRKLPKRADGKHMTPAEAWAAKYKRDEQVLLGALELRQMFMPAVLRTAKRGQVTFFNQTYAAPELMRRDVDGREVSVRYDIHDPSFVLVYTLGGEYVCEAKFEASRRDFFPTPVIDMAREKRVKAAVKRREQQIDLALRELQPTEQPAQYSLPEPDAPFLVVQPNVEALSPTLLPSSSTDEVAQAASGRPFFDAPSDRYEWLMAHRSEWTEQDTAWLHQYVSSEDYEGLADFYVSRGLGWERDAGMEPGFKSAL
ncbi:Mu transposase C-terminal domain-containing protein [Acidovorax sp.]|uniref:Mu transposase C-terminal domain-containing protein n=1 Tax=Acidovorax sp. TaxID=1872122 RepID=UPI0027B96F9D|nr:Mu transposase C-terminal domain-containing protein [Acidovorax sp.]